jgi:hypothetical protein
LHLYKIFKSSSPNIGTKALPHNSKTKQASRVLERLACFGDDGDGSDSVYGIWVGVCKKDRHHRHAYSKMTLAVYYCSKQKQ